MSSILQPWVEALGLRHQGVIVSAMRGCDTAARHDPSKLFHRLLRGAVLLPHCGRFATPLTYIVVEPDEDKWWAGVRPFLDSWDHYPNHYVVHVIHAAEIIGYYGPEESPVFGLRWLAFYRAACHKLHLFPETRTVLDDRLNADEALFKARQDALTRSER